VTTNTADFQFHAMDEGKLAARLVVRYLLSDTTVYVTLEDLQEHGGYELIEIAMPRLVTVREEDGPAWLAHGDTGGSVVMLSEASTGALPPNTFWGKVLATLPVVMVGTDRAMCVQEVTSYMDGSELAVAGRSGHRRASLGTVKVHRISGKDCYDMNSGPGTARICGNRDTSNLLVGQKSSCRLDFIAATDATKPVDWLAGAKLVRKRMPLIPTTYYDDKFVYGIRCDEPKNDVPTATFQQCEELIRNIAALTDNSPQVVHLWGWQYRGKDTGYPAVAEVNQRLGGYDAMMHLMEEAAKFNCEVTLSDNYDDAYKSSPNWDTKVIARRPDGELWKSRNWTGEDSYILGLAKYMKGPGLERIRYTCERYRTRHSTHVDVLSYYPIRNDWDSASPASGITNLLEGRYKVLEEFAKRGVDVSSEAVRYAFIGKVSCYWTMPRPRPCPFGGKPVPLLPAIYRRSALWGQSTRSTPPQEDNIFHTLFYNACPHVMIRSNTDLREVADLFYLMMVPWFKVFHRNIESFRREGSRIVIGLEGNSRIDLDETQKTYSVTVDGTEVARNGSTFCPLDESRIAFYSAKPTDLTAPLPKSWNPAKVSATALSTGKGEQYPVKVEQSIIKISVPAQRPVIVASS
jgi:hypothetical protein